MERRLLKDFQIGLVEGLIQDAITSNEKGPKDVFSKIAKAIGRRTSQGSKKKDWNAVARQKSLVRDPIGSTAEGAERRHRQSVRRYILDHQKDSLLSMDANKLVEYNPRLADITPAARVAYAKFKIPMIKHEYEENTTSGDEALENVPIVNIVDETKKGSIVRPRPKSARHSPVAGALPYPTDKTADVTKSGKTVQRTKTLEPKDAVTDAAAAKDIKKTPEPESKPVTSPDDISKPSTSNVGDGGAKTVKDEVPKEKDEESKGKDEESKGKDMDKDEVSKEKDEGSKEKNKDKDEVSKEKGEGSKEKDTDKDEGSKGKDTNEAKSKDPVTDGKHHLKPESPKRSATPKKQGGKSKVTGEILTGWL